MVDVILFTVLSKLSEKDTHALCIYLEILTQKMSEKKWNGASEKSEWFLRDFI